MFDRTRLLITGQVAVENISKRCVKPGEVACGRRHKTDAFISFFLEMPVAKININRTNQKYLLRV